MVLFPMYVGEKREGLRSKRSTIAIIFQLNLTP